MIIVVSCSHCMVMSGDVMCTCQQKSSDHSQLFLSRMTMKNDCSRFNSLSTTTSEFSFRLVKLFRFTQYSTILIKMFIKLFWSLKRVKTIILSGDFAKTIRLMDWREQEHSMWHWSYQLLAWMGILLKTRASKH